MVSNLPYACFNWQAVQATYRLKEATNDQARALELERDKRLDTTRTLKNFEADLLKERDDLKEMIKARDSAESGLASAQKQVLDQTRCLLEAKDQLKITKEQIIDLKKKLAKAEGTQHVTEWAKDEAFRAKEEAEFAKVKAKSSKDKVEEEAYDLGVAKTQATLKAQVPGVCRLYYSYEALKQAGVEASSDLWKVKNVYYPLAIRETVPSSFKAEGAPEEAEAVGLEDVLAVTALDEPVRRVNPEAPQKTAESTADAQTPHVEEPTFLFEPLQIVPPREGSKDLETTSTQLPKERIKTKPKK